MQVSCFEDSMLLQWQTIKALIVLGGGSNLKYKKFELVHLVYECSPSAVKGVISVRVDP